MALITLGLMSRIQVDPVCFFQFICFEFLTSFTFFLTSVRPHITGEQEDFIRRVTKIPLDERKCQDIITLNTLHVYCRGPEPTPEAHCLNAYSHRLKFKRFSHSFFFSRRLVQGCHLFQYSSFVSAEMEAARQKVREATARKKEEERKAKEGESLLAPKAVKKRASKRKGDRKDNRQSKRCLSLLERNFLKSHHLQSMGMAKA